MAYDRDLFVSKESDSLVTVEAGRYGWSFCSWETEAHLGELEASTDSEFLTPEIRLAPVSEEHAQGTWILETIEPC